MAFRPRHSWLPNRRLAEPIRTPLLLGRWTYYFRVPFAIENPANPTTLQLRVLVDDGAILHVNGEEVYQQRMPHGEVSYSTPAINVGDPPVTGPHVVSITNLVSGTNWLAAEVHQWHLDSSDIICGAELAVSGEVTPGIPGTPFTENDDQWIELPNKSDHAVDLTGRRLADGIDFPFPTDTIVGPNDFLVVARNAAALHSLHPEVRIIGNFERRLSHRSDRIALLDNTGNLVDEVRYNDDAPWPAVADGGGSSLELRDSRADNFSCSAWAASDETRRSSWQHYTYKARAVEPVFGPPLNGFSELRLGLLDDGECLLDNIEVIEDPDGSRRSLLQNGSFNAGASAWRLLGNHSHSRVDPEPDAPGNLVLRLVASDGRLLDNFQNMMSDDRLGATVAWDNREIFYDCGVHLHGSMFSRNNPDTAAYNIRFPSDHLFRGVHRSVRIGWCCDSPPTPANPTGCSLAQRH